MSSTDGSGTHPLEGDSVWRWADTHADGLKALAAIAITPLIALFGWQIQGAVNNQAETAETARVESQIVAERELTLRSEQFESDQRRLTNEFHDAIEARREEQSVQDRNAQYVALAISILDEPVRSNDPLQASLRQYAVDILIATSPIDLPSAIAQAFVTGQIPIPVEFFRADLSTTYDLFELALGPTGGLRFDATIDEILREQACAPIDRLGCLFEEN